MPKRTPLTVDRRLPGAFEGETVTRRRFMTGTAHAAGAVAIAATLLPALAFAAGPIFDRPAPTWQDVGSLSDLDDSTYVPRGAGTGLGSREGLVKYSSQPGSPIMHECTVAWEAHHPSTAHNRG